MKSFAKAEMLIRKDISEVFEAMVEPDITTKIWFTKSSGRLDANKTVRWEWEMYDHTVEVKVLELVPDQKIRFDWGNYEHPSTVEWIFTKKKDGTFVSVTNEIVQEDGEKLIAEIRDRTEGFTLVLANLKALLEYGIQLQLVADRSPSE